MDMFKILCFSEQVVEVTYRLIDINTLSVKYLKMGFTIFIFFETEDKMFSDCNNQFIIYIYLLMMVIF